MARRYDHPERDRVAVRIPASGESASGVSTSGEPDVRPPEQFLWRGRLYVVKGVLSHWVEVGAWWRARLPDGLPVRVDEHGREVWRVEASSGRSSAGGVYDLAYDQSDASWTLARALD
jgi:hypothetical protein